jgi:hypothetical protein
VGYSYRVGTVDGAGGGTVSGKLNAGSGNTNPGNTAFVFGEDNEASGDFSTVCGGRYNSARGLSSVVAGGGGPSAADSNSASGDWSFIGSGNGNQASGSHAVVSGGWANAASAYVATVAGGSQNVASFEGATVNGGRVNTASADFATVSGGYVNTASGYAATACGGYRNVAASVFSFAAGFRARANHDKSFVWGSSSDNQDSTASFAYYSFTVRAPGGARFYSRHQGTDTGVQLSPGGGSWSSLCDVRRKNLHGAVNTSEVLQKISTLPLHRWSYKSQDEKIQHIGPTAQDFYAAFHLGESDTTINTLDPDGIALAAIQELKKKTDEIDALKERITKLETLMAISNASNLKEKGK